VKWLDMVGRPSSDGEVSPCSTPGSGGRITRPVCWPFWVSGLKLQPGHPGEQGLQADTHEVGHHRVVLARRVRLMTCLEPPTTTALDGTLDHDGVGADPAVVADFDRAENLCASADDQRSRWWGGVSGVLALPRGETPW